MPTTLAVEDQNYVNFATTILEHKCGMTKEEEKREREYFDPFNIEVLGRSFCENNIKGTILLVLTNGELKAKSIETYKSNSEGSSLEIWFIHLEKEGKHKSNAIVYNRFLKKAFLFETHGPNVPWIDSELSICKGILESELDKKIELELDPCVEHVFKHKLSPEHQDYWILFCFLVKATCYDSFSLDLHVRVTQGRPKSSIQQISQSFKCFIWDEMNASSWAKLYQIIGGIDTKFKIVTSNKILSKEQEISKRAFIFTRNNADDNFHKLKMDSVKSDIIVLNSLLRAFV